MYGECPDAERLHMDRREISSGQKSAGRRAPPAGAGKCVVGGGSSGAVVWEWERPGPGRSGVLWGPGGGGDTSGSGRAAVTADGTK